jgi:2,4-dienoyl-CoA reductase-like NADH-dependent reductase (Old Yellow Enzyme family)/NADPH-dependent 2,4-dienoyl-CoA reductase/sulfur reductase-like enzyme
MQYKNLFSEIRVGSLTLKNRIIFPPISTNLASTSGEVTPEFVYHYARRAKGGASIVTLENMCIQFPDARHGATQPRIDSDEFIPGLSRVAYEIHKYNSFAFMELTHPGLFSELQHSEGKTPVAPSDVDLRKDHLHPHVLTEDEIKEIVEIFAQAALRAKKAFFDGVEIEAAHALLVNQFLSPIANKRTDKFGGSLENRVRFARMIIERIKELCGRNFTVTARLGVIDFVDGGIDIHEGAKIAKAFEEMGYAAVHADLGFGNKEYRLEPMQYKEAWRTNFAEELKKQGVKIPVVAVGMIRSPEVAEGIISDGKADLVALGRTLIADPDWPIKAETNRAGEIKKCIGCSECIKARHDEGTAIRCGVNPSVGKLDWNEFLPPAPSKKKVLVVGAGPAGLEAAVTLKMRGHDVEVWEKESNIGGALALAAVPPGKEKLNWLIDYYKYMIAELGIKVVVNKRADVENISRFNPDAVILAHGARCLVPPIKGIDKPNAVTFRKVLNGKVRIAGKNVVVGGGGLVGCETALYLAQMNNNVTILEMLPEIAIGMETNSKSYLMREIKDNNIKYFVNTPVKEIKDSAVVAGDKEFPMDYFVVAFGGLPDRQLYNELRGKYETYILGDAVKARKIIDAVREGFETAKII